MTSGYRNKEPSTREHPSAGAMAGTTAAVVVEKEKRIRLEASKRRRAHILRAKVNEETEEEEYRLALSKRQHEQQEYARSVRKNIRSWRKQGSSAPVRDKTVHEPAQPWEQKNGGGTPVLSGTGKSVTRPAKITSTEQGNANVNWSPSNSVGAGSTLEEREDAAEMTGISAWTRHEAAGRVETISPKLTAVIDRSYLVSSDVGVEGGVVAGRDSGEQSRGGRWANLPPELRAIKDRWLGSSSEEITPQAATSDITVSAGATITTPAHGGRQDQHPYFQEYRSRVVPRDKDVRYAHPNILVEGSAPHDNPGRLEGAETKTPSETVDEREKQGHGCGEDSAIRTISSDSLECSRLAENGLQVTRSAEGRDAHHPRLRQADAESLKDSPQRQLQQQGLLHPTANGNGQLGQSSRDDVTPRGSGELGDRTPPDTQEGKVSGLAEDAAAPSIEEWFGEILPLLPGEAVGDLNDGHRRAKVRNQLRDMRNRLPNGATGEVPTAVSPKPVNVNDAFLPAQQPTSSASARTQQPWKGGAQPGVGEAEGVDDHGRRRDIDETLGDNKRGAQDTLRPATLVQRVPSHGGEETVNQRVDGTLTLDIAAFEERERESTGEQQGVQKTLITRSDVADVEGRSGQGNNYDTTNTRSRPSELFDSLDVSARASEDGGGLVLRAGGRSDEIGARAIPATARFGPGTEVITPQRVRSPDKAPENNKILNRDHALNDQNVSTMAALRVETHSVRFIATSGDASPPRRDRPLVKAVTEEATEPMTRRPPNQATERFAILRPERAVQSPPTVPSRKSTTKPTGDGKCKLREPPHASRLRAPGWGREAVITAILPAKVTPGMAKDGSSPATTASHNSAAPTDPAVLPWDLLTPVTEAATVDERSVVSHGTHGTTRMTPASSVASGCRPPQGEASDAIQGRAGRRRPHRLQADANRYATAAAPVVCALESPAETSGFGDGRNQNGSEKRAVWGSGTVASGAHSAPGTTSTRSRRRDAPAGGALTSSSAYRASPLSSTADRVGTGGSVFSSAGGETNPGRQFGGGYVAAMGRRARSMARCEAARRLAAAMAADRGRPSTPISERARWGKGKESQVEVERRKLLQRRAEYAEELQKKAKEAMELARRKCAAANTSTMLPADPRHVRAGATSATSTAFQQDSTPYDADTSIGGCQGKVPSAIEANFTHDTTRPEAIDGHHKDKPPCLAPGSKVNSPVSSRRCDGLRVGVRGDDGGVHRRQKARRQTSKRATQEEEEEQLTASIARLDTLLRQGAGEASRRVSVAPMPGGSGRVTTSSKSAGRVERRQARAPAGGIAKTRVRRGATKDITSSAGPLVNVEPKAGLVSVAAAVPVHATAVADAGAATMASPGLLPPIFGRIPAHAGCGREMGRYEPPDAVQQTPNGPSREVACREPASHCPVGRTASSLSYRCCADDEQRRAKRTDGGPVNAAPGHNRQEGRRPAGAASRWVGDGNDRYHYDARASPRCPDQREERWVPQTPCSPARYRGVDNSYDNHRGWHDHSRGGSYYRREDLRAAIDPRDAPGVVDHARWIGESRPEAYGDDRGGETDWIRRDGGTTFQHEDRKGPFWNRQTAARSSRNVFIHLKGGVGVDARESRLRLTAVPSRERKVVEGRQSHDGLLGCTKFHV